MLKFGKIFNLLLFLFLFVCSILDTLDGRVQLHVSTHAQQMKPLSTDTLSIDSVLAYRKGGDWADKNTISRSNHK